MNLSHDDDDDDDNNYNRMRRIYVTFNVPNN
jgi:hypothetical protein